VKWINKVIGGTRVSENEPYIKSIKRRLKYWISEHGQINRSIEFTPDPGDFACDPSEILARAPDQGVDGSVGSGRRAGEAELEGG